jgi:hypothetical protein
VGIFDDTHIACFVLVKTPCILSWGLVGASHPHGGINNSNLMLSLEGVAKLTLDSYKRRDNVKIIMTSHCDIMELA